MIDEERQRHSGRGYRRRRLHTDPRVPVPGVRLQGIVRATVPGVAAKPFGTHSPIVFEGVLTKTVEDAALGALAERALEVRVTHNEAVSCDDLACALGVSSAHAWEIANTLQSRGYAIVDQSDRTAAVSDVMTAGKQAPRFRIATQPMSSLAEYGSVPIRFTVTSVFDVRPIENGLGGWRLTERQLDV